ncbi:Protein MAIN-LIKE 1 [Glycine soja]
MLIMIRTKGLCWALDRVLEKVSGNEEEVPQRRRSTTSTQDVENVDDTADEIHDSVTDHEHTESKLAFQGKKVDKFRRPTLEIEGIMVVTGLSSLITCSLETGDKRLLSAFAKRWHKKISSFPLPIGELTITLDDIASLLHLSITGAFPTFDAIDVEEVVDLLVELLEASTQEAKDETEQCKMTYVRLAWLGDIYHNKLFCKYYL